MAGPHRTHLQENLSLDREDIESLPVFTRHGGWSKAQRVFGPTLPELIEEINQEVAA